MKSKYIKVNIFLLVEMETLEDHPIFNPAIKISHQQNERKKAPLATDGESALNFNLFEKPAAATEEEKGKIRGRGLFIALHFGERLHLTVELCFGGVSLR